MIEREAAESFDLDNGVTIEIGTVSFRSTRGYTIVAALLDELAFWPTDDSANPDSEVIAAIRPGMATIPNAMLLCASSPYARRGSLHDAHRRHFGQDDDPVLVWQAATRTMNPTVPQAVIDEAYERDRRARRPSTAPCSAPTSRRCSPARWSTPLWSPAATSSRRPPVFATSPS